MKLLEFEVVESEQLGQVGRVYYIVKLSTENERELYERTNVISESCPALDQAIEAWEDRVNKHLNIPESMVYSYIMDDEKEPKVGEIFELTNIKLRRKA